MVFYIISYSLLFFLGLKKIFPNQKVVVVLALLPGLFDLIETSFIIYSLKTDGTHQFFNWLGVATFLKWATGGFVLVVLAVGATKRSLRVRGSDV